MAQWLQVTLFNMPTLNSFAVHRTYVCFNEPFEAICRTASAQIKRKPVPELGPATQRCPLPAICTVSDMRNFKETLHVSVHLRLEDLCVECDAIT